MRSLSCWSVLFSTRLIDPPHALGRYLTGNTLFVDGGSHINGVAWTPDLDA